MQEKSKVTYSFGKLTMVKSDKTPIKFMKKKRRKKLDALLKKSTVFSNSLFTLISAIIALYIL